MRLIDAEKLEKEGWILERNKVGDCTICTERMKLSDIPTVRCDCSPLRQGDIVKNLNNETYGIVIALFNDKNAAQILEWSFAEKKLFVNCPPLGAVEKTGKHLEISRMLLKGVKE